MSKNELENIIGGVSWQFWSISISVISFVVGVLEGIFNNKKCIKES